MSSSLALLAKRLRLNDREWLTRAACAPWWTQRGWFVPQMMLTSRRAQPRARGGSPLEDAMAKKQAVAVYRIVDVVGVSETSWEGVPAATPWKRQPARCVTCASRK